MQWTGRTCCAVSSLRALVLGSLTLKRWESNSQSLGPGLFLTPSILCTSEHRKDLRGLWGIKGLNPNLGGQASDVVLSLLLSHSVMSSFL